jgi:hypothetical protein
VSVSAIALACLLVGGGVFAVVHAVQHQPRSASGQPAATPTQTEPVAGLTSTLRVTETVTPGPGDGVQGFRAGTSFTDDWVFNSDCTQGTCQASLIGAVDGQGFQATLTRSRTGSYSGTTQINNFFTCGSGTGNASDATLDILVTPTAAATVNGQWTVSRITGSVELLASSPCSGTADLKLPGS